ncbi:MAG: GH92 family glycosyl hydrolase [Oscillospiraceae bacterium]|jgi:predicted alpha-1,2-mannosidase|nr:GH92 family glycosyl hydrolase [Oscillospiraceae bacterium]
MFSLNPKVSVKKGCKIASAVFLSLCILTSLSPVPAVRAEPIHEFYASFETSEAVQALSDSVAESSGMDIPMATAPAAGPNATADPIYGRAWDGSRVLRVTGTQPAEGRAYSTNLIYDNLDISVAPDTVLSYVLLPDYSSAASVSISRANFDWDFTSQYMSLDLEFSDGTRLSTLGGVDQYGYPMTGAGQGAAGHLFQKQWNQVKCIVGDVAAGKTITKIYVNYEKTGSKTGAARTFGAYIDCLRIRPEDIAPKATPVEYANIFVGTSDRPLYSRGLQWPAVMTPNGFNAWCPSNQPLSRSHLGGTDYITNKIFTPYPAAGLTHITVTHEASAWIGDFGTFNFMPNTDYAPSSASLLAADNRRTLYDQDSMIANPAYFSVDLSDAEGSRAKGVKLELTPTEHAAYSRMTFPADAAYVNVILDAMYMSSATRTATAGGNISFEGGAFSAMTAWNSSEGRSANMYVYGEFSPAPSAVKAYNANANATAMVTFPAGTTEVTLKVATSFIGAEQAKKNLDLEIAPGASFDEIKAQTSDVWNALMGTVQVEGASEEDKVELYSNLYRLYADPLTLSENTGTAEAPVWTYASPYKGTNGTTRTPTTGYKFYYNNGFWDTYRGSWSAYQFLTPAHAGEMLDGLVQHFVDSDWLARWIAPGGRNSMVGTSSDIILGDAAAKGGVDFDLENAYLSALKNASVYSPSATSASAPRASYAGRAGMDTAPFLGYTTTSVSWALDNYLNDLGVSILAEKLGHDDEAVYFRNTAQNFVNLWNYNRGGWFIGKNAAGAWNIPNGLSYGGLTSADTTSAYYKGNGYEETNGFTTAWQAFADMQGLVNLYGGKEKFTARLDKFFTDEVMYYNGGRDYALDFYDTKMGQYGHANQPDHHIPYMYCYAGQPYKTQALTREILDRVYTGFSFGQGFPGDADNGEQSGWYVMTMIGLYPFSNGADGYIITSPMHPKTTLNLPSGKLEIIANNNSRQNVYIQSMTIDGQPYDSCYIKKSDLLAARRIVFEMGPRPSDWACDSVPPSLTPADSDAVPNPLKDFTLPGVTVVSAPPENNHAAQQVYATNVSAANAALLFNNTSGANAAFTAPSASITYYFPDAKKVEMVTLTSASVLGASAPDSLAVYGSRDGENWELLENREGIAFAWARQTKPFAIGSASDYLYYRLDLTAGENLSLSEIELSGYPVNIIKAPKKVMSGRTSFAVTAESGVANLWVRDSDFNQLAAPAATVSAPTANADGTKSFTVTLDGPVPDHYYLTAVNSAGQELTASRKTIGASAGLGIYAKDGNAVAEYDNTAGADAVALRLIIVAYDGAGRLAGVVPGNAVTVAAGDKAFLAADMSAFSGCSFTAFAWNGAYTPVCEPAAL